MTTNPYDINHSAANSHTCVKFLGSIPSEQLEYAEVYFWNNVQTPLPKHTWDLQIIARWNILKTEIALMPATTIG